MGCFCAGSKLYDGATMRGKLLAGLASPRFFWASFALFLAFRLLLLALPLEQVSDAAWYLGRALEISRGQGYVEEGGATAY